MLDDLLKKQSEYNNRIRKQEGNEDPEFWTSQYLLGMTSEINECLDAIQWKRHRKRSGEQVDLYNLTYELADIFKYILSICEVWGISADGFMSAVWTKTEILEQQWRQEFEEVPTYRPIIITDIDGTLGDWRSAFISWSKSQGIKPEITDPVTSLMLDSDLSIRYPNYYLLKEQFERGGGYRHILPYADAQDTLRKLQTEYNAFVIAVTARPVDRYHRIWYDTWTWLSSNRFWVDQLHMSAEPRILLADELNGNRDVILWEDDPGLMLRAANSGIRVFARKHGYNQQIRHENVTLVEQYSEITLDEYFPARRKEHV